MGEQQKYLDIREWAKELLDIIPNGKLMGIVGILEGAALIGDEDDPFYNEENLCRLRNAKAQIEAGGGTVREL